MNFGIDLILEFTVAIIAGLLAIMGTFLTTDYAKFSTGFIIILIATMFDIFDELISHIIIDIASKVLIIVGLTLITLATYKMLKETT